MECADLRIIKRNGDAVKFDPHKITNAVTRAFKATQETDNIELNALKVMANVVDSLGIGYEPDEISTEPMVRRDINIEDIQDRVETILMTLKFFKTAKAYIMYRVDRSKLREKLPGTDLQSLAKLNADYFEHDTMRQFVYFRTYARWIESLGRREFWPETVSHRYMAFMKESLGNKLSLSEYEEVQQAILKQEVMPSMRLLQFAGPAARRCNVCVYNCSFTAPECFKDLADIMYLSMSGTGVGFSVEAKHVEKFPVVQPQCQYPFSGPDHKTSDGSGQFVVEDSKEGWADAFQYGLERWYAGKDVIFDYSRLRPAGARLKTMGGRSSGPQPLKDLMAFTKDIIFSKQGQKLSTLNMHDIICKIGQIVVSGGQRRSAMISISDLKDNEIRDCKNGDIWINNQQRYMSNNSAVYNEKPSDVVFMKEWLALAESGSGERGIFNRSGLRKLIPGRRLEVLEGDISNLGGNPCMEILLQPYQFCNLSEVVCRSDDTLTSLKRKIRIATIIGTYQATLSNFQYISPKWKENQEKERLLGVSLTGMMDCPVLQNANVLTALKHYSITVNREYATRFDINPATAITAVKPSGTVSQLVNASSGIHARYAPYYIRRIRITASDPLFQLMKDQGYTYWPEVGQVEPNVNTYVLEFAVKAPDNAICTKDMTALQQLEYWKIVKTNYTEHNPSVTISVKPTEWFETGNWVLEKFDYITGLSFLPFSEHIYALAPYEEITREQYEEMSSKLKPVDFSKLIYYEKTDTTDVKKEVACAGGVCEL